MFFSTVFIPIWHPLNECLINIIKDLLATKSTTVLYRVQDVSQIMMI